MFSSLPFMVLSELSDFSFKSKTKPKGLVIEAYEEGHRDFGENYAQVCARYREYKGDSRVGLLHSNGVH